MNRNLILAIIFGLFTATDNLNCTDGHDLISLRSSLKVTKQNTIPDTVTDISSEAASLKASEPLIDNNNFFDKINLLQDSWPHFSGIYQYSTIANGADLYENNIINGLYSLLVAVEKKTRDGHKINVPDITKTTNPLGKWLYQFFYRTGATLSLTKTQNQLSYYLTPTQIGQLYVMSFDVDKNEEAIKMLKPKKMSWPQFNIFTDTYKTVFAKNSPTISIEDDVTHNLARAILMSFFWAKFIINSHNTVTSAQENIAQLYTIIDANPKEYTPIKHQTSIKTQTNEIIEQIESIYNSNLPNPPKEGTVILPNGQRFADCGESCIRSIFLAAFYKPKDRSFLIPDNAENPNFYSFELRDYFSEFSTLSAQYSDAARQKWGLILSNRPGIEYFHLSNHDLDTSHDLSISLHNIAALIAQLAPGSYQDFLVATGKEINLEPEAIYRYLISTKEHAKKFLQYFAKSHNLQVVDLSDNNFNLQSINPKDPAKINYTLSALHMYCHILSNKNKELTTGNPLFDYFRERVASPLIFIAYALTKNMSIKASYLKLLATTPAADIDYLFTNLKDWGLISIEDQELFTDPEYALLLALKLKLNDSAKYIIENYIDKETSDAIAFAVEESDYKTRIVKELIEQGFNLNIRRKKRDRYKFKLQEITPLELAVKFYLNTYQTITDTSLIELLLKNGADYRVPSLINNNSDDINTTARPLIDIIKEKGPEYDAIKIIFEKYATN